MKKLMVTIALLASQASFAAYDSMMVKFHLCKKAQSGVCASEIMYSESKRVITTRAAEGFTVVGSQDMIDFIKSNISYNRKTYLGIVRGEASQGYTTSGHFNALLLIAPIK